MLKILTDQNPKLNLHIYTSIDKNIKFISNILIEKYDLKKVKTDYSNNLITYELLLEFKNQEFKLTNITLLDNDIETKHHIGLFQTITINQDTTKITSVVQPMNKTTDYCNLHITIYNSLYESIYLSKTSVYKKNQFYGINIQKIDPYLTCVKTDDIKTYTHITINNDLKYEQISGILIFNYLTSLSEYVVYINFYINFNEEYIFHI